VSGLTPSSSGAVGGTASSLHKQVFLVAHLPARMAGQLSPAALSLGVGCAQEPPALYCLDSALPSRANPASSNDRRSARYSTST
jgi:hypothetical protein